jgi:rsbT co-antagonist protein RsbR
METLLNKIVDTQSELVILDVTGVASIDTEVASHIMKTVQAANLLGANCVLTGIRPEVAQTVIHLGLELEKFATKRDMQDGLKFGLEQIGYEIRRKDTRTAD